MNARLGLFGLLLFLSVPAAASEEANECHDPGPLVALGQSAEARLALVRETGRAPPCQAVPAERPFTRYARARKPHDYWPYQKDVTPYYSISSRPDERWVWSLADAGIRGTPFTHVISFEHPDDVERHGDGPPGYIVLEQEAEWVRAAGMIHVNLAVPDLSAPDDGEAEALVIRFLEILTTPGVRVLAHCHAGQGRTHTFKALFRIAVQGWSIEDAVEEARTNGVNHTQREFIRRMGARLQDPSNPLKLPPELLARLCITYAG